ncbi:hypothetical protein [Holdemania massiliensis]|uniref:hypothetical protein n=1 Tax=Holdemania massiliensis TaxID=1468449 RepID=UPI000313DF4D|nr:hypothetical protein [Holdemania massiliensis]
MFKLIIISIILGLFVLSIVIPKRMRSQLAEQLSSALLKRDFIQFDQLIEKRVVRFVFDPFNVDFMKLNAALVKGDPIEIDQRFAGFDQCRLSDKQKEAVYYNAFYYYVSRKDKARVKQYGNQLLNLSICTEKLKAEIKKYYAVMIDHAYADLKQDLDLLDQLTGEEKAKAEFLISKMYENQGNERKAKEYLNRSLTHLHPNNSQS